MSTTTWIVWHPDGGEDGPEDGHEYLAENAEEAAQKWAEDYDESDYPLTGSEDNRETVKIIAQANDPVARTFHVWASISVDYCSEEVTP